MKWCVVDICYYTYAHYSVVIETITLKSLKPMHGAYTAFVATVGYWAIYILYSHVLAV